MSRWGKNRLQPYTLPLDVLVKEKENTNRPVAARSAGTIGKWGITSFTSIRARPVYGFASITPKQDSSFQYYSNILPQTNNDGSHGTCGEPNVETTSTSKPKKFFKSRNSVPDTEKVHPIDSQMAATSTHIPIDTAPIHSIASTTKKLSLKINKKQSGKPKAIKMPKPEKVIEVKPEKPSKKKKKPTKSEEKGIKQIEQTKPTRVLSRARKAVDYAEQNSRSPTPKTKSNQLNDATTTTTTAAATTTSDTTPLTHYPMQFIENSPQNEFQDNQNIIASSSPSKNSATEHPPIVLRISKGTSRLVSTDSEGLNNSQSPSHQPQLSAAAALVAVLSDEPPEPAPKSPVQQNVVAEVEQTEKSKKQKSKPIKLKLKTNAKEKSEIVDTIIPTRTRKRKKELTSSDNQVTIDVNQGNLFLSTEFDEQTTRIIKNLVPLAETIDEQIPIVEQPKPRRRTAAAKKVYKDTEEIVVPPLVTEPLQSEIVNVPQEINVPAVTKKGRKGKKAIAVIQEKQIDEVPPPAPIPITTTTTRSGRATRNKNNGTMMQETNTEIPQVTRSYGRKRKQPTAAIRQQNIDETKIEQNDSSLLLNENQNNGGKQTVDIKLPPLCETNNQEDGCVETKILKTRGRRQIQNTVSAIEADFNDELENSSTHEFSEPKSTDCEMEKSVKLVISKKKGSIFKSRAIESDSGESKKPKRHVYKHKWDDELCEEKSATTERQNVPAVDPYSDDLNDIDAVSVKPPPPTATAKLTRPHLADDDLRIRNVKKAHQMQEIGEFQEMDDDVEYILELLKSQNPIATRSLAAIQLASKCMTPAFRMHVRAHGTATKFFSALHDANQNQSLGLCTATIMFVLIQDNLNMDLDKESLELMLNLLDSNKTDINYNNTGLTDEQLQRNEQKVLEICRDIKSQGKAPHLNLENISIGTLAMETLLTLTSKRAGEWFKDELRKLGGLEHIINTICDCCQEISDYVIDWTEDLLEKLRTVERCLRVLENVSTQNQDNQKYILEYQNEHVVETLTKFYKLCATQITMYPTTDKTPVGETGVVLREALLPTLKVLINLTHTFNKQPLGAIIFGKRMDIFEYTLQLLFHAPNIFPEKCIFELSLLVLLLLINLTAHYAPNRVPLMEMTTTIESGHKTVKVPAIKALIEHFYKYEELASFVEKKTDDILDHPEKMDKTQHKTQEEMEDRLSTLQQKATHHMEHTMLASYVCILIGHLAMDNEKLESNIRKYLRDDSFKLMVQILEKYYNFLNLTASSESHQVAHIKETKAIIQFLKDCDSNGNEKGNKRSLTTQVQQTYASSKLSSTSTTAAAATSNSSNRSNTRASTSNNAFNEVFFSGR